MRCRGCNKEIEEYEIFCDDCKKELKKSSSKTDVRELEKLIEDQKKLTELENTKELDNLSNLVEEKLNEEVEQKEENLVTKEEIKEDTVVIKENKNNKKKLVIIIISIICVLLISLILILVLLNKDKEEVKEPNVIDYEDVVNNYGTNIEDIVESYIDKKDEIPTWQMVSELITYNEHDVVCDIHNIYSDGSIYLNSCKVNNKKTKYSYGIEKEEIKEGKKINVYKIQYENDYYSYSNEISTNLVGTITCKTENCDYISAYDKYVLIKEDNEYYIYNYETDSMEFGPFNMYDEYSYNNHLLVNYNTLYGIYYNSESSSNIYNIKTGKTLKNIKGNLVVSSLSFDPSVMYKYNYAVFNNNGENNFINLNTGNTSYSIEDNLGSFIEDEKNNIVYIASYKVDNTKFKIYNSNGKLLFDGKEFSYIKISNGNLIVATNRNYKIYDSNLKVKISSKEYDEILGLYDDFVVVTKDSNLIILSIEDVELANFEGVWDNQKYIFHSALSGWYTENGNNGIYLVIENKNVPYGTLGSGFKYYYIPNTQEIGVIETTGVS